MENEVHQYQADLVEERKKVADLRVALASAQRLQQQGGSAGSQKPSLRRAQSARPLTQNSGRRRVESGSRGPTRPNSTVPPRPFSVL